MTATNAFFTWFYYGLSGLGGWLIFLLLALAGMIWLLYDSSNRRLPAIGWRLGVILTTALILPAIIYRFTVDPLNPAPTSPLVPFSEPIFYLGILGGILPIVLAVGYYVTYQGMVGCPQGHIYEAVLGQCPYDAPPPPMVPPMAPPRQMERGVHPPLEEDGPLPVNRKRHVHAWLVTDGGKNYQLCENETTIGRSQQNDIYLTGDKTISRQHAKILEQNGHFRLLDLGSKGFTRVNGRIVREPVLLESDDEIKFGDRTVVRFVTTKR
jgi:hypothetical protein